MELSKTILALAAAAALTFGIATGAGAATSVDVTYELSDSSLSGDLSSIRNQAVLNVSILDGSMQVTYGSNSATSMPISTGPVTLQSLKLTANVSVYGYNALWGTGPATEADIVVSLVSPATGSLQSGGTLAFGTGAFRISGTKHCLAAFSLCVAYGGVITSVQSVFTPVTASGAFSLFGSPGAYGGAQSTRHTVSGTVPVPTLDANFGGVFGVKLVSGANLVGREVLREADGHDPKVIPEPGTLLLLGSGAAGLGLLSRTRTSRRG